MSIHSLSRRDFVRLGTGAAVAGSVAAGAALKATVLEPTTLAAQAPAGGRKIRFVSIGTGIRGCDLLRSAKNVPTGECVGTADLYEMHQKAGIEAWGSEIPTTKDYRSLLDRKDVDAVIVAVADFQHRRVVLDAVAAGKDVYCEKPMSHNIADGQAMVEAIQAGKRIFQAGSQRVSNIVYKKAARDLRLGAAGRSAPDRGPLGPQFALRRLGLSDSRPTPARRPSTGRLCCGMRRSGRLTPRASSAGAASRITARAWPAISLSICSRECSASAASTPFPAGPTRPAA